MLIALSPVLPSANQLQKSSLPAWSPWEVLHLFIYFFNKQSDQRV